MGFLSRLFGNTGSSSNIGADTREKINAIADEKGISASYLISVYRDLTTSENPFTADQAIHCLEKIFAPVYYNYMEFLLEFAKMDALHKEIVEIFWDNVSRYNIEDPAATIEPQLPSMPYPSNKINFLYLLARTWRLKPNLEYFQKAISFLDQASELALQEKDFESAKELNLIKLETFGYLITLFSDKQRTSDFIDAAENFFAKFPVLDGGDNISDLAYLRIVDALRCVGMRLADTKILAKAIQFVKELSNTSKNFMQHNHSVFFIGIAIAKIAGTIAQLDYDSVKLREAIALCDELLNDEQVKNETACVQNITSTKEEFSEQLTKILNCEKIRIVSSPWLDKEMDANSFFAFSKNEEFGTEF